MFNTIKQVFNKKQDYLPELIQQIEIIRQKTDVLVLFPQNTGYSWLGVKTASISLFPDYYVELPHYYSNSLLTTNQQCMLGTAIKELSFKQVVFSGFLPYFKQIAKSAKTGNPALKIKAIYHGFLSELAGNEIQKQCFSAMIALRQSGIINELGFVKKGLSLTLNKLYGFRSCEIILKNPAKIDIPKIPGVNIGIMVNNSFRKNMHNMSAAALLVDSAQLHVSDNTDLLYLPNQERIISHGEMHHKQFISLLAQMTINLHVTFSESSGGLVCSESISQGVPCISAHTSSFFDYNDYLKSQLVVDGFDDSWSIYQKIESVMNNYDTISKECVLYSVKMNELAQKLIYNFINI